MPYIVGLILLTILFIVLHFFTEISIKQKISVVGVLAIFIISAYLFNKNEEVRRLHLESVLLEFTHGKDISCSETSVNNTEFSYSSGTQSFLGKKDSKSFGRIISLDKCK